MFFIFSDTFKGDDYGYGLFKGFLDGYVEKFYTEGGHLYKFTKDVMKDLYSNPSRFDTLLSGQRFKTDEDCVAHMEDIAKYTREFMDGCCINKFFEHYKPEWASVNNGYPIAQFNAMQLSSTLKAFAAIFTRTQLYEIHKVQVALYHEKKKTTLYMTCSSGIDRFGISNPFPRFRDTEKDEEKLSTRQMDIQILKVYFDKYNLVKWNEQDTDGHYETPYGGYTCARKLGILNSLKYKHMNLGKKGRRVLDIRSKSMHHNDKLDIDKDVIGYWKHNERTYRKGVQM